MTRKLHSEEEALTALQAGEENGLHFFFDRYYTPLIFFCQSIVESRSIAEEIASEAFVKLWGAAHSLAEPRKVKFFLYRVVRNASIDHLRHQKTGLRVATEYEKTASRCDQDALHKLIETETHHRLYTLINQLPFKCRQVFQMFYFQDKAMKEIADELGVSINTVKTHKQRALQLLKENSHMLFLLLWVILK